MRIPLGPFELHLRVVRLAVALALLVPYLIVSQAFDLPHALGFPVGLLTGKVAAMLIGDDVP